jgi:phospholipid transport system transporter-binding protein
MALIEQQGQRLVIRGGMTVETIAALLSESLPLLTADVEIDLGEVGEVDSSAISLMFEWLRLAQNRKVAVTYVNLPSTMISLAKLYEVLEIIPRRAGAAH